MCKYSVCSGLDAPYAGKVGQQCGKSVPAATETNSCERVLCRFVGGQPTPGPAWVWVCWLAAGLAAVAWAGPFGGGGLGNDQFGRWLLRLRLPGLPPALASGLAWGFAVAATLDWTASPMKLSTFSTVWPPISTRRRQPVVVWCKDDKLGDRAAAGQLGGQLALTIDVDVRRPPAEIPAGGPAE